MNKKIIVSISIVVLCLGTFFTFFVINQKNKKMLEEETIGQEYMLQNKAFGMNRDEFHKMPFSKCNKSQLQINLNAYKESTNETVAFLEIEQFLKKSNQPYSFYKEENQNIYNFVKWYNGHSKLIRSYEDQLTRKLFTYHKSHPESGKLNILDLTPKQINDLDREKDLYE
ncbi:hypothetical protein HB900_14590 [Listeria booriae]|uniref:hypothetical protein n=1 Tax=Listeria booriae TaxID=1552123 RepID=UPI0016290AA3|nr:hypothetical protein [Listeria booriae]MBC1575696.1 hypothetical protein [Listeria booriae]MBC2068788.1 hypothetical protein [Listeria booriae]